MTTIDPKAIDRHLAQGLRERAADLGDEDQLHQRVMAMIAVLPQRGRTIRFGRRTRLMLVAVAVLSLIAGSLAVGGFFRQSPTPLESPAPLAGMIAVAADARAGESFEIPLRPRDVEFGPRPSDVFVVGRGLVPRRLFPSTPPGVGRACPAFSPDGIRFMHRETSEAGDATYIISRFDGSGVAPIAEDIVTPPNSGFSCAKWSPDGRSIAYEAEDAIGQMELHVQEIGGGEIIFNPTPNATDYGGYAWSPVDRTIAYSDNGLFIVPVDGSPARLLMAATEEATIDWVTWAPDGSTLDVGVILWDIVAQGDESSGRQTGNEIRRIRLDGTIEAVLPTPLSGQTWPTIWAPDGQAIAYGTEVGIVVTSRSDPVTDVLPGGTGGIGRGVPLAWSPDGRDLLAVMLADGEGGSTLALISRDLSTVSHLTPVTLAFSSVGRDAVSWQPSAVAGQ